MTSSSLWPGLALALAALAGCTSSNLPAVLDVTPTPRPEMAVDTGHELDGMIARYAQAYDVPVALVHRVVKRESNYNPSAYNSGNYGLMQIRYKTAKGMGYDGSPKGLFDAETNLKYAVKYLRGAYLVADGDQDRADWLYRTGYYYDAKRKGLLVATGLKPASEYDEKPEAVAALEDSTTQKTAALGLGKKADGKGDRLGSKKAEATSGETTAAVPAQVASSSEPAGDADGSTDALPGISMAYAGSTPSMPATAPIPAFRPE
jgi:hypothetical protein